MKDCLAHACQIEESPLGREVLGDIVRALPPCRPQNSRARGTRVRQFGLRACANQRPDNYRGLFFSYHEKDGGPATRMAVAALIREQLAKAQKYAKQLAEAASQIFAASIVIARSAACGSIPCSTASRGCLTIGSRHISMPTAPMTSLLRSGLQTNLGLAM